MNNLGPNYEVGVIRIEEMINDLFMKMERHCMDILIPLNYMTQIENGFMNVYGLPPYIKTRRMEYLRELRGRQLNHLLIYVNKCLNGKNDNKKSKTK